MGEKRLAGRLVLVCSRRENSSLLITFILILRVSFSFRLWLRCMRRDVELSENSWLISVTAAFTSTSMMDRSWDSRFRLPGGMSVDMFHSRVCWENAQHKRWVSLQRGKHNGLSGSMTPITVTSRKAGTGLFWLML